MRAGLAVRRRKWGAGEIEGLLDNARAQPKTNFAPNSVIRTWTGYQTNVA